MKMIERRKGIEKTVRVVFVAVGLGHVIHNFFTVFDDMTVTVDDRVPSKGHSSILLGVFLTHISLRTAPLSRRAPRLEGSLVFGLANRSKLRTADCRFKTPNKDVLRFATAEPSRVDLRVGTVFL